MGLWSDASKGEESPWKNHRNAKPTGRSERVSELLADTGKERHRRDDDYSSRVEGALEYHAGRAAKKGIGQGGSTPRPSKKMKTTEKISAEVILWKGRPKRGKK